MAKRILKSILLLSTIILISSCAYIKFSNPDMTDMRLLINYWKVYLAMLIDIVALGIVGKD